MELFPACCTNAYMQYMLYVLLTYKWLVVAFMYGIIESLWKMIVMSRALLLYGYNHAYFLLCISSCCY
jgi:hypothetical protein